MKNNIIEIQKWINTNFDINNPTMSFNLQSANIERQFIKVGKVSGIYILKNIINNKMYIGSTNKMSTRISTHLQMLNYKTHHSSKLQNAVNKYDYSNFQLQMYIYNDLDRDFLYDIEEYLINTLDSYKNGYNMVIDSRSYLDKKYSLETREQMSCSRKNTKLTEEHKRKIGITKSIQNSGTGNPNTHLTKENVLFIRSHVLDYSCDDFCEMFGIGKQAVRSIIHLRSWLYEECIPDNYIEPREMKSHKKVPIETVLFIRNNINNFSTKEFCKMFNLEKYQVNNIKALRTYTDPKYIPENYSS